MTELIRIVIAEDQAMVLGALAALIELEPDLRVVAQVRDGPQALAATLEHQPDVLITDIEMPLMSGLDVARELQQRRDSNHRYTTNPSIRDQMVAKGGIAEGYGPSAVALCGLP